MKICFRFLAKNDLPKMHRWLNADFVARFWKPPMTMEEVEKKYGAYIAGAKPTSPYIIMIDGVDVGYIQTYYYSDYGDDGGYFGDGYFHALGADKYLAGVDLFIGHKDYIHKGYGVHVLRKFMKDYIFSDPKTVNVIITPEPDNAIAIRTYAKVGFRWYKTIVTPNGDSEYLMSLSKEDFSLICEIGHKHGHI